MRNVVYFPPDIMNMDIKIHLFIVDIASQMLNKSTHKSPPVVLTYQSKSYTNPSQIPIQHPCIPHIHQLPLCITDLAHAHLNNRNKLPQTLYGGAIKPTFPKNPTPEAQPNPPLMQAGHAQRSNPTSDFPISPLFPQVPQGTDAKGRDTPGPCSFYFVRTSGSDEARCMCVPCARLPRE